VSDDYGSSADPTRLCPTCRMPISILATKCRHCGDAVARPRREEAKLTIRDLGGESGTQYTISGNVMDALEAFRAEELNAQIAAREEKRSGSWFGRTPAPKPGARSNSSLPELDNEHLELSALSTPRVQSLSRSVPQTYRPTVTRTAFTIGAVIAGLILLYVGTDFTWARISDYLERRNVGPVLDYTSRAPEMLAAGAPFEAVYREAADAVRTVDKEYNQQALEEVRQELFARVDRVLKAPTLDLVGMDRASRWAAIAAELDRDPRVQEVWQRASRDVAAYKMILTKVDASAGEATFQINNVYHDKQQETVMVGQYVQDRFLVTAITERAVRLEDTRVVTNSGRGRPVLARPTTMLSSN
jgi:hypothetical protein